MAKGYNLTVQLNLQGPKNLNNIVNNINQKLNNIQATVNVKTSPQTSQVLQKINNSAKGVKQSADQAANSMEKFGKSAGLAIKRFGAFTAATAGFYAITRATTQSLEKFIEYDRQLTRISQVTGTAKDSLTGLSGEITRLSVSLGASSSSLAEVSVTLSQAGLSAEKTEQALEALALTTLAPTFSDINQTVEGSIALMKQFSIETNQLEAALGSINAVAGQFAVEAGDIITAIQRTGGVFAAASNGVSQGTDALNEFIAVFTSVRATTRESAETIATGLRTIFTRIQREDTLDALREFGVELTDLEGKFVGPFQAIQRLSEGLRSLDPRDVQFSSIVEELGGFRQVGKVIPLIQQFTTAQQALNVAQQGSGSLAQDAAIGQQSLGVQISKVQQEFDALIRSIGQTSEFKQFIQLSLDLASALIQITDAVKPLIPALTALGAVSLARGIPSIARGFRRGIGSTGYHTGGVVTGSSLNFAGSYNSGGLIGGKPGVDKNIIRASKGEYVIQKPAVDALGTAFLDNLQKNKQVPGYAVGGLVNYPSSRRFVRSSNFTYEKPPGISIADSLQKETPLAFQRFDAVDVDIKSQGFNGAELAKQVKNRKSGKRYRAAIRKKDYKERGLAFEEVLYDTKQVSYKPSRRNATSRIDNMRGSTFVEIKSVQEKVDDRAILDKTIGAIFASRGAIDEMVMQRASRSAVTSKKDILDVGQVSVFYDTTPLRDIQKTKKDTEFASSLKSTAVSKIGDIKSTKLPGAYNGGNQKEGDIRVTRGEYIINKQAAARIGINRLNDLNNAHKNGIAEDLPKFHNGGAIGSIPGYNDGRTVDNVNRDRGVGSTIGLVLALQGAASSFSTSIEDAASVGAAKIGAGIQGAVSGINLGIIGGEIAGNIPGLEKFAGPIGLATGAAIGLTSAFIESKNAAIDFANKISKQRIQEATDKISSAFNRLSNDVNNLRVINDVVNGIKAATSEISQQRNRQIESNRLGFGNIAEYFLGETITGGRTQEQIVAGTSQDTLSAQRSLVLELKGFSAYLNTLGSYIGDNQIAQQNLANEIRSINERRAVESSREFATVADSATKLIEQRLKQGVDINDIINAPAFKALGESLARANPEVEKFILNTQANTALTQEEKNRRIESVVSRRAEIEAIQRTAALRQQIEIDNAQRTGRNLETILSRVFQNFEQTFAATATKIAQNFANINLDIAALSGRAEIGIGQDTISNILENPLAFSGQQLRSAVSSLNPILGPQADTVSNLAIASTEIEGRILRSINRAIQENPNANPEAIARIVRQDIQGIVTEFDLPPDIARVLGQQITAGIESLRSKSKDKIALDTTDVRESIVGFGQTIDSLGGSLKVLKTAQSTYRSALEKFVANTNSIIGLLSSRNQYIEQSFQIAANGALRLNEAFGRVIESTDILRQEESSLQRQTGGLTDPADIFRRIIDLDTQRQRLQPRLEQASTPDRFAEFRDLSGQLVSTNIELNAMQQALRSLAESSRVADAALSDISRIQQQRQDQAGFIENLITSTPEQIRGLNQAYSDLQRLLSGQINTIQTSTEAQRAYIETLRSTGNRFQAGQAAQGVLAQERGNVLSLVKELGPFLGSSREASQLRASVLENQLRQLGLLTPQFTKVIEALRNPKGDPQLQQAINIYREAVNRQSTANNLLGQIANINARNAEQSSAQAIANAIANIRLTLTAQSAQDIASGIQVPQPAVPQARAAGGVIYAAAGQGIEMQARGTDTVPAMLTPGEFVVNRKATAKNRGLLESINSGKTQYYQYGGFVSNMFDNTQPRGTTEQSFVPIERWEDFGQNFVRDNLFTSKDYSSFTPDKSKILSVSDYIPQNIEGNTQNTLKDVKDYIYNAFSSRAVFAGRVPELVVEKTGIYDQGVSELYADFGTASRIAKAVKELQKDDPAYANTRLDTAADIAFEAATNPSIYTKLSEISQVPKEVIKSYTSSVLERDRATGIRADKTVGGEDRIQIYLQNTGSFQSQKVPIEQYGLYSAGFQQLPSFIEKKPLNEQNIDNYKKVFQKSTNFIRQKPTFGNIKEGQPTAPDVNNPWNFNDGSFYGLYKSFGVDSSQEPFGPNIQRTMLGGYQISSNGNQGEKLTGFTEALDINSVLKNSDNIYNEVIDTRTGLKDNLIYDPELEKFVNNLKSLYSGSQPFTELNPRFFNDKRPPIMGLSSISKKIFDRKAKEQNEPFSINWRLGFNQNFKNLGLLRNEDQIKSVRDKFEEITREFEKQYADVTSDEIKTRISIPSSAKARQLGAQAKIPLEIPVQYKKYSGIFYDDQINDYMTNDIGNILNLRTGLKNVIIPSMPGYDSFLNGSGNNDLIYNSPAALAKDFVNEIPVQQLDNPLSNYIYNNEPIGNIETFLSSIGYEGKRNQIFKNQRIAATRQFSINEILKKSLDNTKNKLKTVEFTKPEEEEDITNIVPKYNDMVQDSINFWGGIRGPFARYVTTKRIGGATSAEKAKQQASNIAEAFKDYSTQLDPTRHLYARSMSYGFGDSFANIDTAVIDSFTSTNNRGRVNVNTIGAATSYGQKYFFENYAGEGSLPNSPDIIDKALQDISGNPAQPQSFQDLFNLFVNPYNKYNSRNTRSRGLSSLYQYMKDSGYYERRRRGPVPSAEEASFYYGNLIDWYRGGIGGWRGQDTISEELSSIPENEDRLNYFRQLRLNAGIYGRSNRSHYLIGGGVYGRLPNLADIAKINNVNPLLLAEGGPVLLDVALRQQASAVPQREIPLPLQQKAEEISPITGKAKRYDSLTGREIPFSEFLLTKPGREKINYDEVDAFATGAVRSIPGTAAALGIGLSTTGVGAPIGIPLTLAGSIGASVLSNLAERSLDPEGAAERDRLLRENKLAGTLGSISTGIAGSASTAKNIADIATGTFRQRLASAGADVALGEGLGQAMGSELSTGPELAASAMAAFAVPGGGTGDEKAASAISKRFPTFQRLFSKISENAQSAALQRQQRSDAVANINAKIAELIEGAPKAQKNIFDRIPIIGKPFGKEGTPVLDASTKAEVSKLRQTKNIIEGAFGAETDITATPAGRERYDLALKEAQALQPKPTVEAGDTGGTSAGVVPIRPEETVGGAGKAPAKPPEQIIDIDPRELTSTGRYKLDTTIAAPKKQRTAPTGKPEPPAEIQEILAKGREFVERKSQSTSTTKSPKEEDISAVLKRAKETPLTPQQQAGKEALEQARAREAERSQGITEDKISATNREAAQQSANQKEVKELLRFAQENNIRGRVLPNMEGMSLADIQKDPELSRQVLQDVINRAREARDQKFLREAGLTDLTSKAEQRATAIESGMETRQRMLVRSPEEVSETSGPAIYDLEKSSGLSKYEFDEAVRFAKTNDFSEDEFKRYLAKRLSYKKANSDLLTDPESLRQIMLSGTRPQQQTPEQIALANLLKSDKPDPQYDPKYKYTEPKSQTGIGDYDTELKDVQEEGRSFYSTGGIVQPRYLATGGQAVAMTPRGTDTVPAMLTPGEFVVNRESAQKNMGLLKAINRSKGGITPKYLASGGFTTNMINTDPLYQKYYAENKFAGYASPSDKIKDRYYEGKRGLRSMVDSGQLDPSGREYEIPSKMTEYGFGLDAANRPVLNSPTGGYGDPRSNEKDYSSIFSPNGNGPVRFRYFKNGGIVSPSYLQGGGLTQDQQNLVNRMGIPQFRLADGVDLNSSEEVGMALDMFAGNLKSAGANAGIVDYMRSQGFRAGLNYAGGNQNQNTPGLDQSGKENDPMYGSYYAQTDSRLSGLAAGGQIYLGKNEYGQANQMIMAHELGHAVQNFEGTPDAYRQRTSTSYTKPGDTEFDRAAAALNLTGLQSVQDFVMSHSGKVEDGGAYNAQQLLGNKQSEIFATLIAQASMGNNQNAMALRDVVEAMGLRNGGMVKYLKDGGQLVDYSPKGTDTVPAMLTPGEFVVNREAAQKNMGLLQAINKNKGGMIKNGILYAADGGGVSNLSAEVIGNQIQIKITVDTLNSGTETQTTKAPETSTKIEAPQIDFTNFTNGVNNFDGITTRFSSAIDRLTTTDFGVINQGALALSTSAQNLGGSLGRLNTAINNFSNQTNTLIDAMNRGINGTINVNGTISVSPMQVNIEGLAAIEARLNGFAQLITSSLATALAQDNPGFNTSSLSASTTLS